MSRGQWTVTQAICEERQGSAAEAGDSEQPTVHSKTQQLSSESGPQYLLPKMSQQLLPNCFGHGPTCWLRSPFDCGLLSIYLE